MTSKNDTDRIAMTAGDFTAVDEFIGNRSTAEVHHKNFARAACNLDRVLEPLVFTSLAEARTQGFDLCAWCFKSER